MSAAIALERVTVGYGATTVLRDVDLVAPPGAVTALIGPNGAGKTTLLNTASGLLRPQLGRILIDGRDMTNAPPHVRVQHGICHVPEGRAIFRSLTVRENLTLHERGQVHDPLDRAVQAFPRLGERMGQVAGTLSGGSNRCSPWPARG